SSPPVSTLFPYTTLFRSPLAKLYGPRLADLAREFEGRGVAFVGVNSNREDSITALGRYGRLHHIPFPLLKDVGNVVADRFGAERSEEHTSELQSPDHLVC